MKNKKLLWMLVLCLVLILTAGLSGGAMWWMQNRNAHQGSAAPQPEPVDDRIYKYVNLDKVIVMLRTDEGQRASHYLAVDLVIKTPDTQEKALKDHLPLLRSVAVRALSSFSLDTASAMTIDQFSAEINRAFNESYERERREKPFAEAMIGKLIIE